MQVTVPTLQMKKLCYDKKVPVLVSGKSWVVVKPQVEGEVIRAQRGEMTQPKSHIQTPAKEQVKGAFSRETNRRWGQASSVRRPLKTPFVAVQSSVHGLGTTTRGCAWGQTSRLADA